VTDDARLSRWTTPLALSCADPRQHAGFDTIRDEIAKLESPTGGITDWAEVLRIGDAFLAETGRDLLVASAVASALAHREGISGVVLGTQLLASLLADATTTPTRPRARANALQAFVARAEIGIDTSSERPRASLELLASALRNLAEVATRTLASEAPSLRPLEDRARSALAALPVVTAAPTPVFAPPPPIVTAPSESLPDRAEQVPAFVRRVSSQLIAAASLTRAGSPLDADALRLTLTALYLPICAAPETTRDARTALPAPPKLVLETLAKQQSSAAPESLVRDALAALERNRFALDLHVHLARSLERAGSPGARAREVHRHEVRGLLTRLPELLDREFADGTRFASAETRALFASAEDPPEPQASLASEDPLAALRALARQGRMADALALGTKVRHQAGSGRARFEATYAMAALAEEARALPLAIELHAELLADLDRHALDGWDPTLATDVLRATVRLAPSGSETARAAFARLARIDARAAFEISASIHATPAKPVR
jgi:type VI secretion system protein VasJ